MQSPEKSKILVIDGPDGLLRKTVSPFLDGLPTVYEVCGHLYEAVRVLSDLPSDMPVIAAGSAGELLRENGSFFTFLSKRPNILCISLDPIGLDYSYSIRQAIWKGQLLICRTQEEMQQALGWAVMGSAEQKPGIHPPQDSSRPGRSLKKPEHIISPEELDALFHPKRSL